MPRRYSMGKRMVQEAETRRRIVEATMALHRELGVIRVKPTDIAARANVAVTTYYKHFHTLGDLVRACTGRGRELFPPPEPASLMELPPHRAVRISAMVRTLFDFYELREPYIYVSRTEERLVPELQSAADRLRGLRDAFVNAALGPAQTDRQGIGVAMALVDFWAWRTLRRELDLTQEEVIGFVTTAVQRAAGIAVPDERAGPLAPPTTAGSA